MDAAKIQLNPRFIVDEAVKFQEVVLAVSEYHVLMDLLEEYADLEAIETTVGFTPLEDVVAGLRRDGLL